MRNATSARSCFPLPSSRAPIPCEWSPGPGPFLTRAAAWYATAGITIERVISDNGACYRSRDWAAACAALSITPKRTRPYRPQTNGKVERFHRTLTDEWAYARPYATETERRTALEPWRHAYNHHRGHTALRGQPPASRVTNLTGQNS